MFDTLIQNPKYLGTVAGLIGAVIAGLIAYLQHSIKKIQKKAAEATSKWEDARERKKMQSGESDEGALESGGDGEDDDDSDAS
jgi:Mn2+/Fe2+ NRAMP family transporter